jgi:hypothetical protein
MFPAQRQFGLQHQRTSHRRARLRLHQVAEAAKPTVKDNAQNSISSIGLDGVLYLLGYHDRHIDLIE